MYYNDNDKMEMIYIVAQDDEGNIIKTENKKSMIFFLFYALVQVLGVISRY